MRSLWKVMLFLPAAALAAASLEVNSDEGWCVIYLDGAKAGEIPLNGHQTVIRDIAPGEHFLKITDAFDETWYEGVVPFADGDTLRAKAEPMGFTVINRKEPAPRVAVDVPKETTKTKVRLEYLPYKSLPTLVYLTSSPPGMAVTVDGRDAGATPLVLTELAPGKHAVVVGEAREELDVQAGVVTRMDVVAGP